MKISAVVLTLALLTLVPTHAAAERSGEIQAAKARVEAARAELMEAKAELRAAIIQKLESKQRNAGKPK